jgi:3-hydroxybutyryl-CoA dehydrogenase
MRIEEVLVLGAGVMGRQIALQCAMCGYQVSVYDVSPTALKAARAASDLRARQLEGAYFQESAASVVRRIHFTGDLAEAASNADLVSENVPEDPELKGRALLEVHGIAPAHAIFTTNTSTLIPSMFADQTGRPERLLALHFHQVVWEAELVDVMPHAGTAPGLVDTVTAFAKSLRQLPIVIRKEARGYVYNFMLRAYLDAALELWGRDCASIEDIDRAWMRVNKAAQGPFGAMDVIGLDVMLEISRVWRGAEGDEAVRSRVVNSLEANVKGGRLGVKSGEGFYRYPNPAYARPDFLRVGGDERIA